MAATPTPKVDRMYRVIKGLSGCVGLTVWIDKVLLSSLKTAKFEMAHMDPSEIIAMPYDLERLSIFAMVPVVTILFIAMLEAPQKLMSFLVTLLRLTLIVFALLGLCGTNLVHNTQHSMYAALYMASLLTTTINPDKRSSKIQDQLPFNDKSDIINLFRLYGTLLVTIAFQTLQILDWGIQVQRWPIPIVMGTTYGYVTGTMFGILVSWMQLRGAAKQKK